MSLKDDFRRLTAILFVAVIATFALKLWIGSGALADPRFGLTPGKLPPSIHAAGWLNGEPPTTKELKGRVHVVIAWATWCGICWNETKEQVQVYQEFRDQDVTFIGLTDEAGGDLPRVKQFVERTGIPWVNGYGAVETLRQFGVAESRPGVWVIGADGKISWNYGTPGELRDAIERAVKAAG